jgi:cytoskeletal protein CcmA (bactofilin family)
MAERKKSSEALKEEIMEHGPITTILGPKTDFDGVMEFDNSIQIQGKFEGEIRSKGLVVVDMGAYVKANISASVVIIAGEVEGNVVGMEKVNILAAGKLVGNIKTAKLKIADGVIFDGNSEMIKLEK